MITLADNTLVVTGGSAIDNGIWGNPNNRSSKTPPTKTEERIDHIVGIYLLAQGLVGKTYGYIRYRNLRIIQTHKYGFAPQSNITFASLLKYMIDSDAKPLTIKNPWWMRDNGAERCLSIRRQIENYLEHLGLPTHYVVDGNKSVHRLMFA